jgi:hypothetical protein
MYCRSAAESCLVRDLRHLWNIQYFETGIADGLTDHQAGIGPDRGTEFSSARGFTKVVVMPKARQRMGEAGLILPP